MRFKIIFPLGTLAMPMLAQAGLVGGASVTQAGPRGFTALGAQLILAPHSFNVVRLRYEASVAAPTVSDGTATYSNFAVSTAAVDYVHYRHGWNKPGFLIGCGISQSHWDYASSQFGPATRNFSGGGAQFIIGGQFNANLALEGRVQFLASGSDYPLPFLAGSLSVHF